MSTFLVTSTDDTPGDLTSGSGGSGTLREAINFANADPDATTITFQAGLGTIALTRAFSA